MRNPRDAWHFEGIFWQFEPSAILPWWENGRHMVYSALKLQNKILSRFRNWLFLAGFSNDWAQLWQKFRTRHALIVKNQIDCLENKKSSALINLCPSQKKVLSHKEIFSKVALLLQLWTSKEESEYLGNNPTSTCLQVWNVCLRYHWSMTFFKENPKVVYMG